MKKILLLLVIAFQFQLLSNTKPVPAKYTAAELKAAKTAASATYLSDVEKEVFYYMNLARINPKKFLEIYLPSGSYSIWSQDSKYYKSLVVKLSMMKPLPPIKPDKELYLTALCLAEYQQKSGETGHERKADCSRGYSAECCSYGLGRGLQIVLNLLIDSGVPSLGHRKIVLGHYSKMGASVKGGIAVLDFY